MQAGVFQRMEEARREEQKRLKVGREAWHGLYLLPEAGAAKHCDTCPSCDPACFHTVMQALDKVRENQLVRVGQVVCRGC